MTYILIITKNDVPCIYFFSLDISIGIVDLLQELTDSDTLNESEDEANILVDALVSATITPVHDKLDLICIGQ